jgi:hypothetical protein
VVGDEGDVDIGLSDEEGLHSISVIYFSMALKVCPTRRGYTSTGYQMVSLKIFASPPCLQLEMPISGDYDRPKALYRGFVSGLHIKAAYNGWARARVSRNVRQIGRALSR